MLHSLAVRKDLLGGGARTTATPRNVDCILITLGRSSAAAKAQTAATSRPAAKRLVRQEHHLYFSLSSSSFDGVDNFSEKLSVRSKKTICDGALCRSRYLCSELRLSSHRQRHRAPASSAPGDKEVSVWNLTPITSVSAILYHRKSGIARVRTRRNTHTDYRSQ